MDVGDGSVSVRVLSSSVGVSDGSVSVRILSSFGRGFCAEAPFLFPIFKERSQ